MIADFLQILQSLKDKIKYNTEVITVHTGAHFKITQLHGKIVSNFKKNLENMRCMFRPRRLVLVHVRLCY